MKKLFLLFMLTLVAMFTNAQVSTVTINGSGNYEPYIDTIVIPVDSTMIVNSLGIVSDTTIKYDTIYCNNIVLGVNTTTCVYQRHILDTTYLEYDTFYANMVMAIPDSGWRFVNWVIVTMEDDMLFVDTIYDAAFCTDWTKRVIFVDLNFERIGDIGITDIDRKCDIKVYPNPTVQYINVDGDFDYLMIYNIRGKRIYRGTLCYFDLQLCPPGVYPFIVVKDGYPYTFKVVKQ